MQEQLRKGFPMTDVFVYYFMRTSVPGGEQSLSNRRATLETIQGKGEAVMQSQQIVDHSELDANGFVIGNPSNESHSVDELWPQIRSLELRAKSRDAEALRIAGGTDSAGRQKLQLESVELRNQAGMLKLQVDRMKSENLRDRDTARKGVSYWAPRAHLR
jgi:hypothetical protein